MAFIKELELAQVPITEEVVGKILQARKVIEQDIIWRTNDNSSWAKCEVKVQNRIKASLELHLNQNIEGAGSYSFALLLNKCYRIVGLDYNSSHKNKHTDGNRWNSRPHIHLWTDMCRDTWAHDLNGTDEEGLAIEQAFGIFCSQCNIDFRGVFHHLPPRQGELFRE